MDPFKIAVADVRITPEELKRTEEYIEKLQKKAELSDVLIDKTNNFFEKLGRFINISLEDMKIIFEDEDYEIMIQHTMDHTSDKSSLRIRKIK